MKNGFWDRVLIYLYVLLTLLIVVAAGLQAFGLDLLGSFIEGLRANVPGIFWRLILIGVCALIALLGVFVAVVVTPSRVRKRNFITLNADNGGQVRIALPAIRQMVMQAIAGVTGLSDVTVDVAESGDDAIAVSVAMDVEGGVHVPTVTMTMQSAIRGNIEKNCGVNVRSVTVDVKSVLPCIEPAAVETPAATGWEPAPQPVVEADESEPEAADEAISAAAEVHWQDSASAQAEEAPETDDAQA